LEVWSLAGWGQGRFSSVWSNAAVPEETSEQRGELDFRMGLLGARHTLYESGGVSLVALGDTGYSTLRAKGANPVNAEARRTRLGLEGRYTSQDGSLTSSLRASARRDSSDGEEFSGSLTYVSGRYEGGLQRHWYEAKTGLSSGREQDLRAVLSLHPQADGTGLGLTLSSGWGTGGASEERLRLLDASDTNPMVPMSPSLRVDGGVS